MADARVAARDRRPRRHRALRRAHALQGHRPAPRAEDIAQAIDSIGGQLDAFTAKEYASYYIKVLDEHLPLAVDLLSDIVLRPAFPVDEIDREKKVILEEIKMVEDTPDDLVHELFTQHFWEGHPLGRPILGTPRPSSRSPRDAARLLPRRLRRAEHDHLRGGQPRARARARAGRARVRRGCRHGRAVRGEAAARRAAGRHPRTKELEQSHVCLGTNSYPQSHEDRYVSYILNTVLGGSMSSRLFQNVREKRGRPTRCSAA